MKKTLILLLITVMLCIASIPCLAADGYIGGEYLLDDADLLSASEEDSILEELASLSEEFGCNVGIITVDHLDQSALSYAHGQYDAIYGGQTYDGILLVINMEAGDREWAISFNGKYASYDDYDLMSSSVIYLTQGDYYTALTSFTSACYGMFISQEYDHPAPNPTADLFTGIAICVLIGIVVALIVVLSMKSKLKSVRSKANANDYVVHNSFVLTGHSDLYLYSNITRVPVPRNTSGGSGGSGGSRGGASGRF
ncbi:MAG: TPM domain-containing protein [Clostridia bacterium]|nr:TPM domain-containing protein [Clostridia bacterium]